MQYQLDRSMNAKRPGSSAEAGELSTKPRDELLPSDSPPNPGDVLPPTGLEEKNPAVKRTRPTPTQRLQKYLAGVKPAKKAKLSTEGGESNNNETEKNDPRNTQHEDNGNALEVEIPDETSQKDASKVPSSKEIQITEDPAIPGIPPKPLDWGMHEPVTADQQEPPKKRGRKPKPRTDEAQKPKEKQRPKQLLQDAKSSPRTRQTNQRQKLAQQDQKHPKLQHLLRKAPVQTR